MTQISLEYVQGSAEAGWRVADSRVSLDSVVHAYWEGKSPEGIVEEFTSLTAEQVYGAIAFYLRNKPDVDRYLAEQQSRWKGLEATSEAQHGPLLERLRRRRGAGRGSDRAVMACPRFLADEDLRGSLVQAIRRSMPDVDVVTVVASGLSGRSDEEILDFAAREGRIVISHDVNSIISVAERRVADGRGLCGLFLAPQSRPTRDVIECLSLIARASDMEEWRDRIVFLPF